MQSNTMGDYVASRAIDGSKNTAINGGSCTHTNEDPNGPWWAVSFDGVYIVERVALTNRGDCCCKYIRSQQC